MDILFGGESIRRGGSSSWRGMGLYFSARREPRWWPAWRRGAACGSPRPGFVCPAPRIDDRVLHVVAFVQRRRLRGAVRALPARGTPRIPAYGQAPGGTPRRTFELDAPTRSSSGPRGDASFCFLSRRNTASHEAVLLVRDNRCVRCLEPRCGISSPSAIPIRAHGEHGERAAARSEGASGAAVRGPHRRVHKAAGDRVGEDGASAP